MLRASRAHPSSDQDTGPRRWLADPGDRTGPAGSRSALPHNYLRACLLLLVGRAPTHGYDLRRRLEGLGLESVDTGRVYRTLRSMEREDLVRSCWEHSDTGPARRVYRLTPEGADRLDEGAGAIGHAQQCLSAYKAQHGAQVR
jgi:PadR family transcriptional regulator PadR